MNRFATRRSLLLSAAAGALQLPVHAQQFAARPIRLLVGFAPGGGTDTLARLYALKLQSVLNTPVIVDNRPGASQLLAIRPLMASPPDGHTLLLAAGSALTSGPGVFTDLPYDPLKDLSQVAMVATAPGVFFVNPALPVRSMKELIDYAKANPGKLNYGSAGVGASNHLQMEYLKQVTGTNMVHIPYKSDQEVAREVAGGSVQVALTVAQAGTPLILAGKLRAIGVTGSQRLSTLPDTPSVAETGVAALKDIDSYTFYGVVGPAGMSPAAIDELNAAVNKVGSDAPTAERMRDAMSFNPEVWTAARFRRYVETELPKWREVGKAMKMAENSPR